MTLMTFAITKTCHQQNDSQISFLKFRLQTTSTTCQNKQIQIISSHIEAYFDLWLKSAVCIERYKQGNGALYKKCKSDIPKLLSDDVSIEMISDQMSPPAYLIFLQGGTHNFIFESFQNCKFIYRTWLRPAKVEQDSTYVFPKLQTNQKFKFQHLKSHILEQWTDQRVI